MGVHYDNNRLTAARRDSSSLISTRISWHKVKKNFLSTILTLGKPTHYYSHPLARPSSLLIRWHEHDATEIQQVCDKVVEQAIANLEEAGYKRSSVKVIGAPATS